MKTVELRNEPSHWLGMTVGAVAGLPASWLAISKYINEQNVQPRDAGGFWLLLPMGAVVGALLGRVISGVLHRLRDSSALEQKRFEKEIQLHHQLAQEKPLHAYYTSLPLTDDLYSLSLITTQFLIQAIMEREYCQAACDLVKKGLHTSTAELLSSLLLPNAKSIETITLSAMRSVVVVGDAVKVTTFDEASGCDSSFWWPLPEGKEALKQFTKKLKESLGCRRPLQIGLNKQKRIRFSIATLGAIICCSLAMWCAISASGAPLIISSFVLLMAFVLLVAYSAAIWESRHTLIIYDLSLANAAKVTTSDVADESLYQKFSRPTPKELPPAKISWLAGLRWLLLFVCVVVVFYLFTGEKMASALASLLIFVVPYMRKLLYKKRQNATVKFAAPKLETAPCPYCGEPLQTSVAKQCHVCKTDWHDPDKVLRRE